MDKVCLYKALGLQATRDVDGTWFGVFGTIHWDLRIPNTASLDCAFIHAMQQFRHGVARGLGS